MSDLLARNPLAMNAKERAEILRKRFKTLFPVASAPILGAKRKRVEPPKPGVMRTAFYGMGQHEPERRKQWLTRPDATMPIAPRPNRRNGVSALTRIAAHFPAKLPRNSTPPL